MSDPETPQPPEQEPAELPVDWTKPPQPMAHRPAPIGSSDSLGTLIPTKNPSALIAYYCGVFSLIPCIGFALGPVAFVLGLLGLKAIKERPELPGKTHAWIGIVLGGLVFVGHAVLIVLILLNAKPSR